MKRVTITNVGEEEYGSVDPWDEIAPGLGRAIDLHPGQSAQVSEQKAAQMQDDFPHWFEFGEAEEVSEVDFAISQGQVPPESEASEPTKSRRRKVEVEA